MTAKTPATSKTPTARKPTKARSTLVKSSMNGPGVPGLSRRTLAPDAVALLTSLESAYAGRDGAIDVLRAMPSDPRAARLATLLSDPQFRGSLADACCELDLAPSTALMLLRDGAVARAVAAAQLRLQAHLPAVVDRIADAATGALVTCGCTIGGQRPALPDCPQCRGMGRVPLKPSLDHQQLVLETLGLLGGKGGGGMTVNVQQQTAVVQAGPGVFDAFVRSTPSMPVLPATTATVIDGIR